MAREEEDIHERTRAEVPRHVQLRLQQVWSEVPAGRRIQLHPVRAPDGTRSAHGRKNARISFREWNLGDSADVRVRLEHESPAPEAGREARGVQAHPGEEPPALPQLAVRRDGLHGSELLPPAMVVRGEISRLRRLQRLREDDGGSHRVGEEDESERPLLLAFRRLHG